MFHRPHHARSDGPERPATGPSAEDRSDAVEEAATGPHDGPDNDSEPTWTAPAPPHGGAEPQVGSTTRRTLFSARSLEEHEPHTSPFGVDAFPESPVSGSAAEKARELANLTGESLTEAVEHALQERLERYRLRNVGIAERLERLAREVSTLAKVDRAADAARATDPDQDRHREPERLHRGDRGNRSQTIDLRG